MRAARWRTNGSRLQPAGTGSADEMKTTVWPVPTWVAETDMACSARLRSERSMPRHGMFLMTKRSRPLVSRMPP